jgi:hypothetical protein
MNRDLLIVLLAAGCLMAGAGACAQAAAGQNTPATSGQKPAVTPPKQEANPFPEDTSKVPVMPSNGKPAVPPGTYGGEGDADSGRWALPGDNKDPVRSPDDPAPTADDGPLQDSSSSQAGMDKVLKGVDDDEQPQGKRKKAAVKEPEHQETSSEDIEVGQYELDRKNWKAALSRFESAMVLAPDEPEVYWGLAESERHLGNLAEARGYYQKVAEYDPDSKHGKEAIKALKEPEIANAKATPPTK